MKLTNGTFNSLPNEKKSGAIKICCMSVMHGANRTKVQLRNANSSVTGAYEREGNEIKN